MSLDVGCVWDVPFQKYIVAVVMCSHSTLKCKLYAPNTSVYLEMKSCICLIVSKPRLQVPPFLSFVTNSKQLIIEIKYDV